jgi:hypothetical protein
MSEGRPEKTNVWFWLAVAGAVLAMPIVAPTIGRVSDVFNDATPPVHASENTSCGALAKALVAAMLSWAAYLLSKELPSGRQHPQPGSESLPPLPAEWAAPWVPPPKESDPSVRPADGPVREPPEANR